MDRLRALLNRQGGLGAFAVLLVLSVAVALGIVLIADRHHKPKPAPAVTRPAPAPAPVAVPSTGTSWASSATQGASTGPQPAEVAARAFITSYSLFLRRKIPVGSLTHITPALRAKLAHWTGTLPTYDPTHIVRLRVVANGTASVDATALMGVDGYTYGLEVILVRQGGQWLAQSVPSADQSR